MNAITHQTRRDSYIKTTPTLLSRHQRILIALGSEEMTARELSNRMGYTDLNMVKPRLTELMERGKVKVIEKKFDNVTNRTVAVYKAV